MSVIADLGINSHVPTRSDTAQLAGRDAGGAVRRGRSNLAWARHVHGSVLPPYGTSLLIHLVTHSASRLKCTKTMRNVEK